ncbi:MAG: phosphoserine phosphatase SerB [Deltaproteobacteria bacterium]|nr:phosphoserine phosphatase SerB [Deltaproteobacteria bacterium]
MPTSMQQRVLVSVSGPDTKGITATLTGIVADGGGVLVDIEQVVLSAQLTLCLVISVPRARTGPGTAVLKDLLFATKELGLECDFKVLDEPAATTTTTRRSFAVTVIGDVVDASCVHALTSCLAAHNANIDEIRRLSDGDLSSLEIVISTAADDDGERALQGALVQIARDKDVDLAFQVEDLARYTKRLVVFDMDSTLIRIEVIDELARAHGVYDEVAALTATAMAGGIPYEESLKLRVLKLAGLPVAVVQKLVADLPLTDGAEDLLRVLRALGFKTAVISGGFSLAADSLRLRLGLDYAYSNVLEVKDGKLTGRVMEPIVGPQRKADLLDALAQREGIPLEQTIAIGDGANDLLMLEKAGLGIAFHAKAKLRDAADTSVSRGGIDRVLYLLGLHASDVRAFLGR